MRDWLIHVAFYSAYIALNCAFLCFSLEWEEELAVLLIVRFFLIYLFFVFFVVLEETEVELEAEEFLATTVNLSGYV